MNTAISVLLLICFAALIGRSVQRACAAVAKITAAPDPVRVAILQQQAIAMALVAVEQLPEPPEAIAKRRERLLEKQRNLQHLLAA